MKQANNAKYIGLGLSLGAAAGVAAGSTVGALTGTFDFWIVMGGPLGASVGLVAALLLSNYPKREASK